MFSLVLVSGCISGPITSGEGLVIENFVSSPSEVYAGEPFQLQLMVRNKGTSNARNVRFELSNIGTTYGGEESEISCNPECAGLIEYMLAPQPESGTTGESKTCIWQCTAPSNIPRNIAVTFSPSVRVTYEYESNTARSATIVSEEELRSLETQGKAITSETTSISNAPIRLDIEMRSPLKYNEKTGMITFPISIGIENTGEGVACYPSCGNPEDWNKVFLEMDPSSGVNLKDCNAGIFSSVNLWEGRERSIVCDGEIMLANIKQTKTNILKKTLKIKAKYEYFTDATTSVKVTGT